MPAPKPATHISDADWDRLVAAHPRGHFLQSAAWGRLRAGQGWALRRAVLNGSKSESSDPLQLVGAQVLVRRRGPFRFAYLPRGPVCAPDDPRLPALVELIDEITRDCLFTRIEAHWPDDATSRDAVSGLSLRPAESVQPPSTLRLDLRQDADDLLANMKQKWRYNVRLAARKEVEVREEGEAGVAVLETLVTRTARRNGFHARPAGYYRSVFEAFSGGAEDGGRAKLYVARYGPLPLAAILVVHHGDTATYLYGGSSTEERNRMPNHAIQWHAIEAARAAGLRWYDFWGVPDEIGRAWSRGAALESVPEGEGGLWGVWGFKRGFGGEVWRAVGAFDRVHAPWRYRLLVERLPRLRDRLRRREPSDEPGHDEPR